MLRDSAHGGKGVTQTAYQKTLGSTSVPKGFFGRSQSGLGAEPLHFSQYHRGPPALIRMMLEFAVKSPVRMANFTSRVH